MVGDAVGPHGRHQALHTGLAVALGTSSAEMQKRGWSSIPVTTDSSVPSTRRTRPMTSVCHTSCLRRRRKTIIRSATAQLLLDSGFGIDQIHETPAGRIYNKNGLWRDPKGVEQAVAFFWPNGMEVALFVNSPIGGGASLRDLVRISFLGAL